MEIPANKITVFTGVSGSGKSSLVMDTIYAECRQRFTESFPAYIRAHISSPEKPDYESCSGLVPAIAINQATYGNNPRSTVGTATELYDYYRLLFARFGIRNSSEKNELNEKPLSVQFSFNHESGACSQCKGLGFTVICDPEKLIYFPDKSVLSGALNGTKTGKFYGDIYGQYVHTLKAAGEKHKIDYSMPWNQLDETAKQLALYGTGDQTYDVIWKYKRKNVEGEHHFQTSWTGFANLVNEEYTRKHADNRGTNMLDVMKHGKCPACNGTRLNPDALQYFFANHNITSLSEKSIAQTLNLFENIANDPEKFNISQNDFLLSKDLRKEITRRLIFLINAGIGYLAPSRAVNSLSGGEARRIQIASQLNSGLTGILYVLDEPTIGLHQKDTEKLIHIIDELKNAGNTIAIIEHDTDIIAHADHIIDIGPDAGKNGGKIIAQGNYEKIKQNENSITGKYLNKIEITINANPVFNKTYEKNIIINGAYANNLKHIQVNIPINSFTVITGVSGSGKTSLVFDVLYQSAKLNKPILCESIIGLEHFDSVIAADQNAISTISTSNTATLCGFFDEIRNIFANTDSAKQNKFDKTFFSFNNSGGRCETCQGNGKTKVSMDFMSDIWSECEECHGARFKNEILTCTYKDKSIDDILHLTISEASQIFSDNKKIAQALNILQECGLGYVELGQTTDTFSGGESQRIKLAKELISAKGSKNLYLFDEPTTGLHFRDIDNLLILFKKLIQAGHTILTIEHNQQLILQADHRIEIGPGAGEEGGTVI